MMLRRYHKPEGDPPDTTDDTDNAPPAEKPSGRSTSRKNAKE